MSTCLVYYHVGESIPEHLFDSLYQSFTVGIEIPTYIITNNQWSNYINKRILKMNLIKTPNFTIIPYELLSDSKVIQEYNNLVTSWNEHYKDFRDGFWLHTTNRFLYISAFMERNNINNVFHIETDIMIYENLDIVYNKLKTLKMTDKIVAVQDAPQRAICSIVFLPNSNIANDYSNYVLQALKNNSSGGFLNDMDLMGCYKNKYEFPDSPNHNLSKELGVFDACAIGQYLGGIDFKNIPPNHIKNKFVNPTRGFINETAVFKANTVNYMINKNDYKKLKMIKPNDDQSNIYDINALHIHSKQLYLFSSNFDLRFEDIITGDRIVGMCHFVFCDQMQFNYNTNLMKWNRNVFLIKNFNKINYKEMNECFDDFSKQTGIKIIKLFVYIDNMINFMNSVVPHLNPNYEYELYSHNGDYAFDSKFMSLIEDKKINKIYAQNLDINSNYSNKLTLLPIGIAREVFLHGDVNCLYSLMTKTYMNKKTKDIYINLNASTHELRGRVLNVLSNGNWELIKTPKPYKEYLIDLSQHRFALCVRGNGLDTHRFWECLYLRVVPVIVYDKSLDNFISQLNKNSVPYYTINSLDFFKTQTSKFFCDEIYEKFNFNDCDYLKMRNYI